MLNRKYYEKKYDTVKASHMRSLIDIEKTSYHNLNL
jgi:hypothetical protein